MVIYLSIEFLTVFSCYFLICDNGEKSSLASKFLSSKGFNVIHIIGGIRMWPGGFVNESNRK